MEDTQVKSLFRYEGKIKIKNVSFTKHRKRFIFFSPEIKRDYSSINLNQIYETCL